MKKSIFLFCCFFWVLNVKGQTGIDLQLQRELDSMLVLDQKYRALMSMDMKTKADSLSQAFNIPKADLINHFWALQSKIDSSNLIKLESIIKRYGCPGKSLVGEPANEAAFYIIQHSPKIDQYLPLLKEAAEKGELKFSLYAMMLDRSLMNRGQEQIYGTQGRGFQATSGNNGSSEWKMIIWPIADPANVNKRRKEAGFSQTVEENAKRLGIEYKVFTLEEVSRMQGGKVETISDEATIRLLEEAESKAIKEKDTVTLSRLMSQDIIVHNPENTIVGYRQIMERIKEGKIDYKKFERKIEKITMQSNLAIVMGSEIIVPKGSSKNAGKIVTRRFTNVWIKTEQGWKLSIRQATIISIKGK